MGRKWWLYYSCFLVVWILQLQLPCDGCWEEERVALLRLKPFFPLLQTDWENGSLSDCCSWEGVNCDTVSGRVNNLDLDRTTYQLGYLNASLFLPFQHLTNLSLAFNFFGGCVENGGFERLSALKYLEEVDLRGNYFDNSIFASLQHLSSLRWLYLSYNRLNGSLPIQGFERLSALKYLEEVDLTMNYFDNSIFASLQHLSSLRRLYLLGNRLNGSLPIQELNNLEGLVKLDMSWNHIERFQSLNGTEVLTLPKLEYLDLRGNYFDNSIFASLQHLSSLRWLYLSENRLNGSLPIQELNNLEGLVELDMSWNSIERFQSLNGTEVLTLPKLDYLDLRYNNVSSDALSSLRGLSSLRDLELSHNQLKVIHVKDFDALNKLEYLSLEANPIEKLASSEDGKRLKALKSLDLNEVKAGGNIFLQSVNLFPSLEFLYLQGNKFNGSATEKLARLCKLTKLRELDITHNGLSGDIPSCFSNLTALESLHLSYNKFRIPCSFEPFLYLSKLKNLDAFDNEVYSDDKEFNNFTPAFQLQDLSLSGGQCSGGLPKFLYHQHDLESLGLQNINFGKQHFPYWLLENNTNLSGLDLVNASLFGPLTLPSHPHQNLRYLYVRNNFLNGSIPRQIGAYFPSLTVMSIQNNQVVGSIPSSIGDMKFLSALDLSNNKLSGLIPEQVATGCSLLEGLILSNNSLTGRIPSGLSNCSFISILDISNNNLYGGIPSWIANMTGLENFIMANNILKGPLPSKLFTLPNLKVLDISCNAIFGSIPSSVNLSQIIHIHLSRNDLSGTFPNTLCNSPCLVTLDLSDNYLIGTIPECIKNLDELSYLMLKNNRFNGQIPVEVCQLSNLSVIDLSHNNLVGFIPPCLNITTLHQVHHFAGKIIERNAADQHIELRTMIMPYRNASTDQHIEFRTKSMSYSYMGQILTFLSGIDLSCNNLTGEIPKEIGSLSTVCVLNLSHNSLTGGLPSTISNLRQIESLDLSFNNLIGRIPPQIVELNFLEFFNVSYNNLSGPTPKKIYQFATFEEFSYMGNPFLCGEPLPRSCLSSMPPLSNPKLAIGQIEDDAFMDMEVFYISFTASYITSLLAAVVVLWINPSWRRKWFYYLERTTTCCYYWVMDHLCRCF